MRAEPFPLVSNWQQII